MASQVDRHQNLLKSCVKELQSCVDYVQQYSGTKQQDLDALKDVAKCYCEIDFQHKRARAARDATDRHFDDQENDCTEDVYQIYNKYLDEQPTDVDYLNHSIWHSFSNALNGQEPTGEDESEEDIGSGDDQSVIDEEGIMPSQFVPPVDPITKKIIENPCKNRKCGHVYEMSTVMDHLRKIKLNKVKPRCPYIGCNNMNMRGSFIVKDDALKQQIQSFVANMSAQSDGNMSSNVVL